MFTINGGTFKTGFDNNSDPAAAICTTTVALGNHTITKTGSDNGVYTYVVN